MADASSDEIVERVMRIISEEAGWNPLAIRLESEIEGDLGCTGDRARELMLRLERELGVDMRDVDFDRYFGNDSGTAWPVIVAMVVAVPMSVLAMHVIGLVARATGVAGSATLASSGFFVGVYIACGVLIAGLTRLHLERRRSRRIPITVRDLIDAAHARRWTKHSSSSDRVR